MPSGRTWLNSKGNPYPTGGVDGDPTTLPGATGVSVLKTALPAALSSWFQVSASWPWVTVMTYTPHKHCCLHCAGLRGHSFLHWSNTYLFVKILVGIGHAPERCSHSRLRCTYRQGQL